MALRNANTTPASSTATAAASTPAGQFEAEDGGTVVEQASETVEAAVTPVTKITTSPDAQKAANALIARAAGQNAIASLGGGTALAAKKNLIPVEALETLNNGVFPRITIGLDGISADDHELGKKVQLEVLSWNALTMVSANENEDAEANKLVRSSYDGVNLRGGEGPVVDYVAKLKADGYEKASAKQYIEVWAHLLWSENDGPVPEADRRMYQVSLSPTSAGRFQGYMLESGIRKARGIPDSDVVYMTQEKVNKNNKKWGVAVFSAKA